jgi:hypothetical protein
VTAAFFAWLALELGGARTTQVVDDVGIFLAALVTSTACGWAARGRAGRQWTWLAVFTGLWAFGQGAWAWYEVVLNHATPFPSIADVGFLAAVPVGLVGILAFPAARPLNRLRVVCDGLIVAGSIVGAAWTPVLLPIAADTHDGPADLLGLL